MDKLKPLGMLLLHLNMTPNAKNLIGSEVATIRGLKRQKSRNSDITLLVLLHFKNTIYHILFNSLYYKCTKTNKINFDLHVKNTICQVEIEMFHSLYILKIY